MYIVSPSKLDSNLGGDIDYKKRFCDLFQKNLQLLNACFFAAINKQIFILIQ